MPIPLSTIVEISVVCQTITRVICVIFHLQQQKLVWSVRQENETIVYDNLQQQKLVWSVRHISMMRARGISTIVEISVVCQTQKKVGSYQHQSTIVEISVVCQTVNALPLYFYQSTIVEISVVCQTGLEENFIYSNLQQQKLVWSVRQAQRRLSSDPSTIVEISVVCQTGIRL